MKKTLANIVLEAQKLTSLTGSLETLNVYCTAAEK